MWNYQAIIFYEHEHIGIGINAHLTLNMMIQN